MSKHAHRRMDQLALPNGPFSGEMLVSPPEDVETPQVSTEYAVTTTCAYCGVTIQIGVNHFNRRSRASCHDLGERCKRRASDLDPDAIDRLLDELRAYRERDGHAERRA